MIDVLVRVVAPHFIAGFLTQSQSDDSRCTEAAPILAWCIGKTNRELRAAFRRKRWQASVLQRKLTGWPQANANTNATVGRQNESTPCYGCATKA